MGLQHHGRYSRTRTTTRSPKLSPVQLRQSIIQSAVIPHQCGIIHGDLHGTNVLVRNNDPILIDFYSTRTGPLVADPASLEVSLAFDERAIPECGFQRWTKFIDALFSDFKTPTPMIQPSRFEWLWTTIRQIRLLNLCSMSELEYRVGLIMFLYRYASFNSSALTNTGKDARAYALVIAERLLSTRERRMKAQILNLKKTVDSLAATSELLLAPGDAVIVHRVCFRWLTLSCPCDCHEIIRINLDPRAGPAWSLYQSKEHITMYPSIWRDTGCGSHFIIWRNKILLLNRAPGGAIENELSGTRPTISRTNCPAMRTLQLR